MEPIIMGIIEDEEDEAASCASCGGETVDYLCEDCHERLQYLYHNEK